MQMSKRSGPSSDGKKSGKISPNKSEFYGNSETTGHMHEDEYKYSSSDEQRIQWLQEDYGMTEEEAKTAETALASFTGGGYTAIRDDYMKGRTDSVYYQRALDLENVIQAGPKFNGDMYRGISVSHKDADEIISTLEKGGKIHMQGLASWSSKVDVAEDFANTHSSNTSLVSIVFQKFGGTKLGTPIQQFSGFGKSEAEILCSSKARYGASNITKHVSDEGRTVYVVTVDEYLG